MKASEVLRQALELLGPNGEYWLQGDYKAGDKYCASGAVRHILGESTFLFSHARELLRHQIDEPLMLCEWNDADDRTFADVKRIYEKAIAEAELEELCTPATHSSN